MIISASRLPIGLLLVCLCGIAPISHAQVAERPRPCVQISEFSQFDFWLGDWQVRTAEGDLIGANRISKRADDCVLVEEWASTRGGGGVSVNYYDPVAGEWVQVWNGSGGTQITIRGGLDDEGSMALVGTLHQVGSGRTVRFRGLWTPLAGGRVRQFFEQSVDKGKTWQPWFEGFYTRVDEKEEGAE